MSPESTLGTKITSNVDTSETTPEDSQIGKEGWKPKVSQNVSTTAVKIELYIGYFQYSNLFHKIETP